MGLSFILGRDFDAAEHGPTHGPDAGFDDGAIVIGSGLAHRLWADANPIGRRLVSVGRNLRDIPTFTIVGVVDETTTGARDQERRVPPLPGIDDIARVYKPRVDTITSHLLVRTHGPAEALLPTIRAAAAAEAPALPVVSARTLAAVEASERRSVITAISAAGVAGVIALILSAIGLYAVVAFAVGQRVREIGIRTALGAGSRQVVGLFVRQGLRLSLVGLVIGLALGIGGARVISAMEGNEPPSGRGPFSARGDVRDWCRAPCDLDSRAPRGPHRPARGAASALQDHRRTHLSVLYLFTTFCGVPALNARRFSIAVSSSR